MKLSEHNAYDKSQLGTSTLLEKLSRELTDAYRAWDGSYFEVEMDSVGYITGMKLHPKLETLLNEIDGLNDEAVEILRGIDGP